MWKHIKYVYTYMVCMKKKTKGNKNHKKFAMPKS